MLIDALKLLAMSDNVEFELQHIVVAVKDAITKWHDLGLQLGLPDSILMSIHHDPDTESHLRIMLSKWLSYDPKASWEKLANALTTIDMKAIAANIRSKYMKATIATAATTTTTITTTATAIATGTTVPMASVSNDDQTCMQPKFNCGMNTFK